MSRSFQEAESVEVILSVASPWDVLKSNVTVSTALLQLKMCKIIVASAFVLNLKSVFSR